MEVDEEEVAGAPPQKLPNTEECAMFIESTRIFSKQQKTWVGRQKPAEMRLHTRRRKDWPTYIKELIFTCQYCGESHKGPFEWRHYKRCKNVPEEDRHERWEIPDNAFVNTMSALPAHAIERPLNAPPHWRPNEGLRSERVSRF